MDYLIYICIQQITNYMGYTHYWGYTPATGDKFRYKDVLTEVLEMKKNLPEHCTTAGGHFNDHPITLRNGLGKYHPELTKDCLRFNGDASKWLDHETFIFDFNEQEQNEFCKTARKPYDFFVCVCLISLANHLPNFEFSSDGDWQDWQPAFEFYSATFPKQPISDNLKKIVVNNFHNNLVNQ